MANYCLRYAVRSRGAAPKNTGTEDVAGGEANLASAGWLMGWALLVRIALQKLLVVKRHCSKAAWQGEAACAIQYARWLLSNWRVQVGNWRVQVGY